MECPAGVLVQCRICKNRRPCNRPLRTINWQLTIKCSISRYQQCLQTLHDAARRPPFILSTSFNKFHAKNKQKQLSQVSETKVSALETWKHQARSWQILLYIFEGKSWGKHQNGNSSWLAFDAASDCEDIFVRSLRQLLPGLAAREDSLYLGTSNRSQWMSEGRNGVKTESKRSQNGVKHHVLDRKTNQLLLKLGNTPMPVNHPKPS